MWKSQGDMSGLYAECSKTSQRNVFKVLWDSCVTYGRALSCRRITPCVRRPGRLFFTAFRSFVRVQQYCVELIVHPWGRNSIKSGSWQSKKNESITFCSVIVAFDFHGEGDELCFHSLHTRFLVFGCVVVAPGLVSRNDMIQKCRILLITDQVLETEVHSSFLMIKGQVFWYHAAYTLLYPKCWSIIVWTIPLLRLSSWLISRVVTLWLAWMDHFINGGSVIIGDHFVCLARSRQIWCRLPPFTENFTAFV